MLGFGMGFGLIGLVFMLLFWVGIIALSVWLARGLFQTNNQSSDISVKSPRAKDILDKRYARGEITREQYELMREDLNN
jgi:putative membrane protein